MSYGHSDKEEQVKLCLIVNGDEDGTKYEIF